MTKTFRLWLFSCCIDWAKMRWLRVASSSARPLTRAPSRARFAAGRREMKTTAQPDAPLPVSSRVQSTDEPCIVKTKAMMADVEGVLSLAQGVVHWSPPETAVAAAQQACITAAAHSYGPALGTTALAEALRTKVDVMVTSGANQAFTNIVLTLVDAEDKVVLFKPYYFNHLMALQMTGGVKNVMYGPAGPGLKPDLDWLEEELQGDNPPKMVVIVNPCNPAGFVLSKQELERAAAMTKAAGCWLVIDNTYEHFTYDGVEHACVDGPNILNIFSFSKAYGMMGWRVGYICYPDSSVHPTLGSQMLKVQDTIPICPTQISQIVAAESLQEGRSWVTDRVTKLQRNRELALEALSVLGDGAVAAQEGAIYFFAKLPDGLDDEIVVERLIKEHRVTLIGGSSCGMPAYIRVAYANCSEEDCEEACRRLKTGLTKMIGEAS